MTMQLVIALVIAAGAAVRGNWSPCGESLQAQIHPLGERSRGNSWMVTLMAFTIASVLLGGLFTATLGAFGALLPITAAASLLITAALALVAGALDLSPIRPWTPRRQVNENWIGRYRGWVYGAAFGAQLGVGFSVFVMSWGYYAMLVAAFVSGSAVTGAIIGASFGLGRGLLLYMAGWIDRPERLSVFHARMAALKSPVFRATGLIMIAVAIGALV